MRHAVVECRSERYLRVDGKPPPPAWDAIAGIYKTRDQRFVRLHTNFPHHRDAVCKVLDCKPERDEVQAALMQWDGEAFETAAYAGGCVVAMMRSHEEWSAICRTPRRWPRCRRSSIEKIGEAAPKPWPAGDRPLAGLRVLDLSRVIAGPVAGRTLAVHGADVLLISGPDLPAIPWLTIDTGRGKLTSFVELKSEAGAGRIARSAGAGGYFLARLSPARASLRSVSRRRTRRGSTPASSTCRCRPMAMPGRGRNGAALTRWCRPRPDSITPKEQAAGVEGPKELPAQMLDHATGYLMAFGAMMAKARQSREGGSWHVRVSLAQTGRWLWNLGRVADGFKTEDLRATRSGPLSKRCRRASARCGPCAIRPCCRKRRHSGRARRCRSAATRRNGRRATHPDAGTCP